MCCYYIVHIINNNIRSQTLNQNQTDWLLQTGTELAIISVISKQILLCFCCVYSGALCNANTIKPNLIFKRTVDQILNLRSYAHSCPGKFFWWLSSRFLHSLNTILMALNTVVVCFNYYFNTITFVLNN